METLRGNQNSFGLLRSFLTREPPVERCELCSLGLHGEHPHLIDPHTRRLICACDACALLFTGTGKKYKRVPRRVLALTNFQLSDAQWDGLRIPIEMAFFFRSTPDARVVALYPSPAGPTESLLSLETWQEVEGQNPLLAGMEADVEALLVNRIGHVRGVSPATYYLLPIDKCYELVGLIRANWKGLSGGTEVWQEIGHFFERLNQAATEVGMETHA